MPINTRCSPRKHKPRPLPGRLPQTLLLPPALLLQEAAQSPGLPGSRRASVTSRSRGGIVGGSVGSEPSGTGWLGSGVWGQSGGWVSAVLGDEAAGTGKEGLPVDEAVPAVQTTLVDESDAFLEVPLASREKQTSQNRDFRGGTGLLGCRRSSPARSRVKH